MQVTEEHVVLYQSCSRQRLQHHEVLPIFCIVSGHSLRTDYEWFIDDEGIGVSSPILYVTKEGSYHCKVTDDEERVCTSRNIDIVSG